MEIDGDAAMKNDNLKVVRGSDNVFRDLGHEKQMPNSSRPSWPLKSSRRLTGTV